MEENEKLKRGFLRIFTKGDRNGQITFVPDNDNGNVEVYCELSFSSHEQYIIKNFIQKGKTNDTKLATEFVWTDEKVIEFFHKFFNKKIKEVFIDGSENKWLAASMDLFKIDYEEDSLREKEVKEKQEAFKKKYFENLNHKISYHDLVNKMDANIPEQCDTQLTNFIMHIKNIFRPK